MGRPSDDPAVTQNLPSYSPALPFDGLPSANEATTAFKKLVKLLADQALSWNDIPVCIAAADEDDRVSSARRATAASPASSGAAGPEVNVLDLVLHLVGLYIAVTPEERLVIALWVLHTYVFDRFDVTPRLGLLSPVRGCGKTTLLILLELLANDPYRTDNVTAAVIYHLLERPYCVQCLIRAIAAAAASAALSTAGRANTQPLPRWRWRPLV